MASTNKCEYCGSTITSEDKSCPNCGAANPLYVVDLPRKVTDPQTIEELQEYCAERGMPLLRMRFFIGQDCREPKAFGVYRDGTEYVVYKNKADGSRSVRYRGPDEAYAVGQIYDKLIEECHNRGIYPDGRPSQNRSYNDGSYRRSSYSGRGPGGNNKMKIIFMFLVFYIILVLVVNSTRSCGGGYYIPGGYSFNINDYINDSGSNFYDYDEYGNSGTHSYHYDSSWDDSDWGSDSYSDWDSGGTDWDSDW